MTGCRFPEHHGHGSAGVPAAVVAVMAIGTVVTVCVSHAGAITDALVAILAGMGAVAVAAVVVLVRLLASSRAVIIRPPAALPSAEKLRRDLARGKRAAIEGRSADCICPLPYSPGGEVPCAVAARCMRPGSLPAPVAPRAIAAPPRLIVTAEILEDRHEA